MRGKFTDTGFEDLVPYATQFITHKRLDIEPYHLVDSLKFYIYSEYAEDSDKRRVKEALWSDDSELAHTFDFDGEPIFLELMLNTPKNMSFSLELDFFQWISEDPTIVTQINSMPLKAFERVVGNYLLEQYGNNYSKRLEEQLIKFFKMDNPQSIYSRIKEILPKGRDNNVKGMHYILDRFNEPTIYN